ncbi:MAG TPA: hypothetical protein VLZ50_14495 [Terracidiphilus sp.]|nr:hypothetical protein [Terracidiphilus sp.]
MRRTIAAVFLASTMIWALSSASAQTSARANIPFNFRVGSALMPAGSYEIKCPQSGVISFYNRDGHGSALAVATTKKGTLAPVKLVFNRYGDRYFLSQTLAASGESEMTFAPTRLEKSIQVEEAGVDTNRHILIALK